MRNGIAEIWQFSGSLDRSAWLRFQIWLALLTLPLVYLVSARYLTHIHITEPHAWLYLALAWLSHFSLPVLVLCCLQIPIALLAPRRWILLPIAGATVFLLLGMLVVDTEIYERYRFHLNGLLWKLLTSPGTGENLPLSHMTLLLMGGIALCLLLLSVAMVFMALQGTVRRNLGRVPAYCLIVWLLALFSSQSMHLWYEAHYDRQITSITRHFPAYYPLTGKRWLAHRGWVNPSQTRERTLAASITGAYNINYPIHPLECISPDSALNVLVVIVDALRADTFESETMPQLHRLVQKEDALWFTDHVSGGNTTKGGIFSLFMGIPATYWDGFAADHRGSAWIQAHQNAGYRIGVFSSATLVSPAFDRTVFASVPDLRLASKGSNANERDLYAIADFKQFLDDDTDEPYFAVLFLDSAHSASVPAGAEHFAPQWERVDHLELDAHFDPLPYVNRYRNALYWLDKQIGELLASIENAGKLDNTVLILTSDHGEEFNDLGQNYWGHGSNFARHQTSVPLLLLWPGRSARTIEYRTSHYDIAPTLMSDLLGCTNLASDHSIGAHLLDESTPRTWIPVVSYYNYGIVLDEGIVATWPGGGFEMLQPSNEPAKHWTISPQIANEVIDELSRFYR